MEAGRFRAVASIEGNAHYDKHIERKRPLYSRENEIRSEYERDYTRILHSLAYRRLKHKTQVFFNINNDHVCTRMEHVQHVESVSCTIARYLGLNVDLTRAIAMGHDLGHAPFGHEGEVELSKIGKEYDLGDFWHERNSLRIIDSIELLDDDHHCYQNLNLTYAVRDGIISHCGEIDDNAIRPRTEAIDLADFRQKGLYQPYTWEGCVVKIADKIAYLGRDIEDATTLKFMEPSDLRKLMKIAKKYGETALNTTVTMHNFITSICESSSPETGIALSAKHCEMLNEIKDFNYKAIYHNKKFDVYRNYVSLVIRSIFNTLMNEYDSSFDRLHKNLTHLGGSCPYLAQEFLDYIMKYMTAVPGNEEKGQASQAALSGNGEKRKASQAGLLGNGEKSQASQAAGARRNNIGQNYANEKIYGTLDSKQLYAQAIIDYLSGMTDRYAIERFEELLRW